MPGRYSTRRSFRRPLGTIINSEKNVVSNLTAGVAGTATVLNLALAVDSADNTVVTQVTRRSKIYKIWIEIWATASATATEGVSTTFEAYIIKNPGSNLTNPTPGTIGSSNEKKFIFKTWKGLIASRKEGFPPYVWRGWIKVPRVYQRMGTDDVIQLVLIFVGVNGILCSNVVYKWYT